MSEQLERLADLELVRKIASGGMGEVWEARQVGPRDFTRRLAVKKILPHLTENEEFVDMFLDEGRLVAQLDHPNVCQLFRLAQEDHVFYMEMEYVDGFVLTELIDKASRRKVPIPFEFCAQVAMGVCAGLEHAHSRVDEHGAPLGIIHRDISPPNIMVTTEGYIKILDFGIAKARSRLQHTQPGLLKGKLGYVSPEQVHGMDIDHRSDIFSLGIVLWEMSTCRRLFYAKDEMASLRMISEGRIKPPSSYREGFPPEFEYIIMKALAVRREERFQSCGELQQSLEDFLFQHGPPGGHRRMAQFAQRLMTDLPIVANGEQTSQEAVQKTPQMPFPRAAETPAPESRPSHRVLVTDDDAEIRDAVTMILSSGGYEVETANDGLVAVERVTEKLFDVCMLDLDMPRLDGRGALEQIRMIQPSLPCIIQTGNDSFHMATEMGRRGAVTYLLKPARRRAVLQAVKEALQHRPEASAFDAIFQSDYPTLLAEARASYKEQPNREATAKTRHSLLALKFELQCAWLGALALASYMNDDAFSPRLNESIRERLLEQATQGLSPGDWLCLYRSVLEGYGRRGREFVFRPLVSLFRQKAWENDDAQQAIQELRLCLEPLLSQSLSPSGDEPWDAMLTLALYHKELWRHDALLDDREVATRVARIEAFLAKIDESSYRMIDFNLTRVDALIARADGIHHDLMTFRGIQPESSTYLGASSLEARALYIFNLVGEPLVLLSPFLIPSPCNTENCQRTGVSFPVQLDASKELLYRCTRCGNLRRPGMLVQAAVQSFFAKIAD